MTDNNESYSSGSTDLRSPAQKQHDLKIKKKAAFRIKCRRQRHHDQIKRRKHANLIYLLKINTTTRLQDSRATYKTNIHSLFYAKATRDAELVAIKALMPRQH